MVAPSRTTRQPVTVGSSSTTWTSGPSSTPCPAPRPAARPAPRPEAGGRAGRQVGRGPGAGRRPPPGRRARTGARETGSWGQAQPTSSGLALGEADLLDVQPAATRSSSPAAPGPDRVGHADLGPGQRLADLDPGLGAGLQAEADQPGRTSAMAALSSGSRASWSGSGQSTRWTESGEPVDGDDQPLPQLLGRERRVRGQQQGHRAQAGPQGPEGVRRRRCPCPSRTAAGDSRTYQFDRSSTNVASRRAALVAS